MTELSNCHWNFIISISTILLTNLSNWVAKNFNMNNQIEKSMKLFGVSLLSCIGLLILSNLIVDVYLKEDSLVMEMLKQQVKQL